LLTAQAVWVSPLDRAGHRHPATQAHQSRAHTFSFFSKRKPVLKEKVIKLS
jgi:hypothetical protein